MPYVDKECESCGTLMEEVWHIVKECDECKTNECKHCGERFEPSKKDQSYCSHECHNKDRRDRVKLKCEYCDDQFEVKAHKEHQSYCSPRCRYKDSGVELECEFCGEQFEVSPSRKHQSHCSRECYGKSQRDRVELTCEGCGEQFEVRASKKDESYCSRKCRDEDSSKIELECKLCGEKFEVKPSHQEDRLYCSQECSAVSQKTRVEITCEQCSEQFEVVASQKDRSYCSQECKTHGQTGQNHPRWKGGREPYYGTNWMKMRELVRIRDDHTCMRCGRHEDRFDRELDIHHIIPKREFDEPENANTMDNLVTVCRSCHGKVENTEDNGRHLLNHTTINPCSYLPSSAT